MGATMMRVLFCSHSFRALVCAILLCGAGLQHATAQYAQTNLSSDIPGLATFNDPNLADPRGLSFNASSPFWIANQISGNADLHNGNGSQAPAIPLIVTVPGGPTGSVFNQNFGSAFNGDLFLFSTLNGQIAGWRPALGTTAETLVLPSTANVYTGLAIANIPTGPLTANTYAYAANFRSGTIDVFKGSPVTPSLPGNFTDPNLPAGYAPFNIQTLGGKLFVTYAQQDATKSVPVPGAGFGFIDVFNLDGTGGLALGNTRLVSNGPLNEPWGMAIAPSTFGQFAGDLLVGNHGDGTIDAFDPITGMLLGMLRDAQGNPIVNERLWALAFRAQGSGFDADGLFFTSAPTVPDFNTVGGLFGEIQPLPETPLPAALPLFASGIGVLGLLGWRKKRKQAA
jgi:uncharacterized protein (TIGR03118 family)